VIVSPTALGRLLRPALIAPTALAALLGGQEAFQLFRQLVRELFPDDWRDVLDAREAGGDREAARVWAFCRLVEERFFPVFEGDEYAHVAYEVPFVRNGWSFDRFHDLEVPPGELLLLALCAHPYALDAGARTALLDAAERLVTREILLQVPEGGVEPEELHRRLDGTPYAAAADFADWLWGATGSAFLDYDDEVVLDVPWTRENVDELARQWQGARALLERVTALCRWLEAAPADRFTRLLDAALGRDAHTNYLQERQHYDFEITADGLVPVRADQPLALPGSPAG
jgi:hypothetical protein